MVWSIISKVDITVGESDIFGQNFQLQRPPIPDFRLDPLVERSNLYRLVRLVHDSEYTSHTLEPILEYDPGPCTMFQGVSDTIVARQKFALKSTEMNLSDKS